MRNVKKYFLQVTFGFNTVLMFCLFLPSYSNAQTQPNDTLKIGISVTTKYLMELVNPVFSKANPKMNITSRIDQTGNVVDDVIMGKASVAITTRNLKDFEIKKSATVMGTPIGLDGLVLAMSSSIPINNLSFEQIIDIYTGIYTNWKQLGGDDLQIVAVGRIKAYDPIQLFADFMQLDTKPQDDGIVYSKKGENNWNKNVAISPATDADALEMLLKMPGAVTYFPLQIFNNYQAEKKAIKALEFNGVKASGTTIANGQYFIHRRLNIMTNGMPNGVSKTFVDFMLSKKGQELIQQAGYIPIL
jgi:phosphate transport system substrate-binding protein